MTATLVRSCRVVGTLGVLLVVVAADAPAQSLVATGSQAAAAEAGPCEDAASRIAGAPLPRVGATEWADWVALTGCGGRGATIVAGALQSDRVRAETDLQRVDHLAGLLDGWFQPQLISAYEALLADRATSNAMRLRSMWLLGGLLVPTTDVAGPLQGYMSDACHTYERSTSLRDAPEGIPSDAYDRARNVLAASADDRNAPDFLRRTARCWEELVRDAQNGSARIFRAETLPRADRSDRRDREDDRRYDDRDRTVIVERPTTVVVERPVRVVYECDNRYVFYNDGGYDLAIRYSGYGNGVLRVRHGGPYVWTAARFGPTRFWLGDTELFYSDVVYRPCGGRRVTIGASIGIWTGWHTGLGIWIGRNVGPRIINRPIVTGPVVVYPRAPRPVIVVPPGRRDHDDRYRGRRDEPVRVYPRGREPRREEPRREEPRREEPRREEPRREEPRREEPRREEPRREEPRREEPRASQGGRDAPRGDERRAVPRSAERPRSIPRPPG